MLALKIVLGVIYILICVALVVITLLQDAKEGGISAIGQETSIFNKSNDSKEAFLARATIALGSMFAVLAIVLTIIISFVK